MAFQAAKTDDPAGVGYGILLLHFKALARPCQVASHMPTHRQLGRDTIIELFSAQLRAPVQGPSSG